MKQDSIQLSVTPLGVLSISLNHQLVSSGVPWLSSTSIVSPDSIAGVQLAPDHVEINQVYNSLGIAASFDIHVNKNDIVFSVLVLNSGKTNTAPLSLNLPSFTFSDTPKGTMPSWHWTYLEARGLQLYHPSYAQPLGCVTAGDAKYGLSVWSPSERKSQCLIQGGYIQDNVLANPLPIEIHTTVVVVPGNRYTVSATVRLSTDQSIQGLLSGYKQSCPKIEYVPMLQTNNMVRFQSIDASWVTPTNPGGYNGDARRIDTPDGVQAYLKWQIPRLKSLNALGIIFWAPGGFWPSSMYPVDYDVNLMKIKDTWPILVAGLKAEGFRVGIAARFGDSIGADGSFHRTNSSNPDDVKQMLARIDYCVSMGIDMWYIDTFGMYFDEVKLCAIARKHLGPKHLFFSEFTSDAMLQYSGVYCQNFTTPGNTYWYSATQRNQLQYLFDGKPDWLCSDNFADIPTVSSCGFESFIGDWDPNF